MRERITLQSLALCALLLLPSATHAQRSTRAARGDHGRDSRSVLDHFASLGAAAAPSLAVLERDGRAVALATVIAPDGLLISKASEAHGELVCRLHDGRELAVEALASDPYDDVVLLRVDARDLTPLRFSPAAPGVGRIVLAPRRDGRISGMGIVGVAAKAIEGGRGYLGVVLIDEDEGVVIDDVRRDTPAFRVGLESGDRLLEIGGESVATRREASDRIGEHGAGAVLFLLVEREGEQLLLRPRLATRDESALNPTRVQGDQSDLRAGFPSALQHDVVIQPEECGGPLLALDGRLLGLNIARAGRVKTFAIPAARLQVLLVELLAQAASPEPPVATAAEDAADEDGQDDSEQTDGEPR